MVNLILLPRASLVSGQSKLYKFHNPYNFFTPSRREREMVHAGIAGVTDAGFTQGPEITVGGECMTFEVKAAKNKSRGQRRTQMVQS